MIEPSQRVLRIPSYFFARLGQRIEELHREGVDVIRMDMGSPDLAPPGHILEALFESARQASNHGYAPFGGTPAFRRAAAAYYQRRFGVKLDPDRQVIALIGSKEGLFNLSQALVNDGDVVLAPNPGYPVYRAAALFAGGEVVDMPLRHARGFLPDLEAIAAGDAARAKILWLNYPNNPTGAVAELVFFERAVNFARTHGVLLAHDAPYTEVGYDGYRAPSILQIEGAAQVAVEFNSLSKSFNMAGWRVGMAVGNEQAVELLYAVKSQVDTSQFRPILDAATEALLSDQGWLESRNHVYQERRDLVVECLTGLGMAAELPRAAMYIWAALPAGERSAVDFCERALQEAGLSITPGVAFGSEGEGYVRISLSTPTDRLHLAMDRLSAWMDGGSPALG